MVTSSARVSWQSSFRVGSAALARVQRRGPAPPKNQSRARGWEAEEESEVASRVWGLGGLRCSACLRPGATGMAFPRPPRCACWRTSVSRWAGREQHPCGRWGGCGSAAAWMAEGREAEPQLLALVWGSRLLCLAPCLHPHRSPGGEGTAVQRCVGEVDLCPPCCWGPLGPAPPWGGSRGASRAREACRERSRRVLGGNVTAAPSKG